MNVGNYAVAKDGALGERSHKMGAIERNGEAVGGQKMRGDRTAWRGQKPLGSKNRDGRYTSASLWEILRFGGKFTRAFEL